MRPSSSRPRIGCRAHYCTQTFDFLNNSKLAADKELRRPFSKTTLASVYSAHTKEARARPGWTQSRADRQSSKARSLGSVVGIQCGGEQSGEGQAGLWECVLGHFIRIHGVEGTW